MHVPTFGALLFAALIVAHLTFVRRAVAGELASAGVVEAMAITVGASAVVGAIVAGAWLDGAGATAGILSGRAPLSSAGGLVLSLAAGAVFARVAGLDPRRAADFGAQAFARAWILARAGCALVHDHPGRASSSWLAVRFPEGTRLDMGLLEWMLTPFFLALVVVVSRRTKRPGVTAAALAIAYGAARLGLDFLRESDPRWGGLTAAQWAGVALVLGGGAWLLVGRRAGALTTASRTPDSSRGR